MPGGNNCCLLGTCTKEAPLWAQKLQKTHQRRHISAVLLLFFCSAEVFNHISECTLKLREEHDSDHLPSYAHGGVARAASRAVKWAASTGSATASPLLNSTHKTHPFINLSFRYLLWAPRSNGGCAEQDTRCHQEQRAFAEGAHLLRGALRAQDTLVPRKSLPKGQV